MIPNSEEWDTSNLPAYRRAYLDLGHSFEYITTLAVSEAQVQKSWIRPRYNPLNTNFRQVCFLIHVEPKTYDLLYNAPDGLRGRYWQSPDIGFLATRHLIAALAPKLFKYVEDNPLNIEPPSADVEAMTIDDVRASLNASSAKAWVSEEAISDGFELKVRRWKLNEDKPDNKKGLLWRWTPIDNIISVKGALLNSAHVELIPPEKLDRSCQIHHFGFT